MAVCWPYVQTPRQISPSPGSLVDVVVHEVVSVNKFFVQWRESCVELDKLMADMNQFYGDCGPEFRVDRIVGIEGMLLAAPYLDGVWHRVRVLQCVRFQAYQVLYVDYGSTAIVHFGHLRFLHERFLDLPHQAYRASLVGVSGGTHTTSKKIFFGLARNAMLRPVAKGLVAWVYEVLDEDSHGFCELRLILYDTITNPDVSINQILHDQGEAPDNRDRLDDGLFPWQPRKINDSQVEEMWY